MAVLRKKNRSRVHISEMRNHIVTSQPLVTADAVAYMRMATPLF